jgi:hypothetical protein
MMGIRYAAAADEGPELEVDQIDSRNYFRMESNKRSTSEDNMTDYGPVGSQLGDFEVG